MADRPKSLWRPIQELTDDERAALDQTEQDRRPSAYDDLGWRIWADTYRAMTRFGYSPAEVDDMELWQVAAVLHLDLEPERDGIAERMEREAHTLTERAKAFRPVTETDMDPDTRESDGDSGPVDLTSSVMRQMGIVLPDSR